MASLNLCQFIGNLGADPEVRYTPNGTAVANLSVAVNEKWKDASGEKQERTEWVRVQAWGKLAEICGEYLRKGAPVYVAGRMQTRKWQDKEGNDRYTTEIVMQQMQMLGTKDGGGYQPKDEDVPPEARRGANPPSAAAQAEAPPDFDDQDIPF